MGPSAAAAAAPLMDMRRFGWCGELPAINGEVTIVFITYFFLFRQPDSLAVRVRPPKVDVTLRVGVEYEEESGYISSSGSVGRETTSHEVACGRPAATVTHDEEPVTQRAPLFISSCRRRRR